MDRIRLRNLDYRFKNGAYYFSTGLNPIPNLERAGYVRHKDNEFILNKPNGRFHAILDGFEIALHFDSLKEGWIHYVKKNPKNEVKIEMSRIVNIFRKVIPS